MKSNDEKIITVQIIKCGNDNYWYRNRINECFEVYNKVWIYRDFDGGKVKPDYYVMKMENERKISLYIDADDCVEITRYIKIKKIINKIS